MGVSFKIAKKGTRYQAKPQQPKLAVTAVPHYNSNGDSDEDFIVPPKTKIQDDVIQSGNNDAETENEVSFTLNIFPDGYSIGNPSENGSLHEATRQEMPKSLHPYDRASETIFSAIESGRLPGDILDEIPCKFINGSVCCEVRDYRDCTFEPGHGTYVEGSPIINKVCLKMSLENIVKDIPLIADSSWTYGDLMEVESRILKALNPQVCLNPSPKLERLCWDPNPIKLNLDSCSLRKKRSRQMPECVITSNNRNHGKKVCIDRVPDMANGKVGDQGLLASDMAQHNSFSNTPSLSFDPNNMVSSRSRSLMPDNSLTTLSAVSNQPKHHLGVASPINMRELGSGPNPTTSGPSPVGQDMMNSYTDNMNHSSSQFLGKRENQDGPLSPLSFSKRQRLPSVAPDSIQHQQLGQNMYMNGSELQWRNTMLQGQQHSNGRGQYANSGVQRFSPQVLEGVLNKESAMPSFVGQQGMRYPVKEEQIETGNSLSKNITQSTEPEATRLDPQQMRFQQRTPQQAFMRSGFSQTPWNTLNQHVEKGTRRDDQAQKRKLAQSPRVSAGAMAQSPLSSKSGEFSSASLGSQFGSSQKEKSAVNSMPPMGDAASLASGANEAMQRQQAQLAAKRRSNSLPKNQAISGVGSPASTSNVAIPLNANSPSVGTPLLADQIMLERLSKIKMVTVRQHLNMKKLKVDEYHVRKPQQYSAQRIVHCLSLASNNEDFKDESKPLSNSLVEGSMNTCKTRVITFIQPERIVQGNAVSVGTKSRTRMIMSQKPNDGTVSLYCGEIEDAEFLAMEEYFPTLPNAHSSDLLAAQFCSLMIREGYLMEDQLQRNPNRSNIAPSSQSNANNSVGEMQQYSEGVTNHPSSELAKPTNSGNNMPLNSFHNNLGSARMLPPGSHQALQMSQGLLPGVTGRPQHLDSQASFQQQSQQQQQSQLQNPNSSGQQQLPRFQRSSMLATNPLSQMHTIGQNSTGQLGNQMLGNNSQFHLQMLQQQQQQQQQLQQQQMMSRKPVIGIGNGAGVGNMDNNLVGLGGLGNSMGMGGARGMGGTRISTPLGTVPGVGNMGQTPMSLSQVSNIGNALSQYRSGSLTPTEQAMMANNLRRQTSILGAHQSNMAGMPGTRQMHPTSSGLSMLSPTLNQGNSMNQMQRPGMAQMGPPKFMSGMNHYMTQQRQQPQQQQLQLQQQQQQLQQQQLQQQQQQQQQQMQQQQLQHLQQQETSSPLQAVVSPAQVSSPSTMGIPQQMIQQNLPLQQNSPQQMGQRTPMSPQISSGGIHPITAGGNVDIPASPMLSTQTHGSAGNNVNSPMELQGVNKSPSINNA